jgi:hypothetical protein
MLDNSKVFIYQDIDYFSEKDSERFRFKLVTSHVLMKPCKQITDPLCPKLVKNDDSLIVLHAYKPFVISVRKGHIRLTDLGATNSQLVSLANFMTGFLAVDQKQDALTLTRFPVGFDIRKHQKLADGYFLKQTIYKDRGIKLLKLFNPSLNPKDKEYLLVTTFQLKKSE